MAFYINEDSNGSEPAENLYESFETALLSMLQPLTSPASSHVYDNDEVKANAENIQRYLETSRNLEKYFLTKRVEFLKYQPETLLTEEIAELKTEIAKKDQSLQRLSDKLPRWSTLLNDVCSGRTPNLQPPTMMNPMGPRMMLMSQRPPGMMPQQPGMMGPSPMRPQAPMTPMMGQLQQSHPPHPQGPPPQFNPQNAPPPQANPLAYLERTTSNIGGPDGRK